MKAREMPRSSFGAWPSVELRFFHQPRPAFLQALRDLTRSTSCGTLKGWPTASFTSSTLHILLGNLATELGIWRHDTLCEGPHEPKKPQILPEKSQEMKSRDSRLPSPPLQSFLMPGLISMVRQHLQGPVCTHLLN